MSNKIGNNIETLFGNTNLDEFLSTCWMKKSVHYHGAPSRLPEVFQLDEVGSLDKLLELEVDDAYFWEKRNGLFLSKIKGNVNGNDVRKTLKSIQLRMLE